MSDVYVDGFVFYLRREVMDFTDLGPAMTQSRIENDSKTVRELRLEQENAELRRRLEALTPRSPEAEAAARQAAEQQFSRYSAPQGLGAIPDAKDLRRRIEALEKQVALLRKSK